jgi:hypothetical protein
MKKKGISIVDLMLAVKAVKSRSEVKRLIMQGAVRILTPKKSL